MTLVPLAIILLATFGAIVSLLVLYWVIRLAVRHGIEDARQRSQAGPAAAANWEPARR
jgi:hypothetical protein